MEKVKKIFYDYRIDIDYYEPQTLEQIASIEKRLFDTVKGAMDTVAIRVINKSNGRKAVNGKECYNYLPVVMTTTKGRYDVNISIRRCSKLEKIAALEKDIVDTFRNEKAYLEAHIEVNKHRTIL